MNTAKARDAQAPQQPVGTRGRPTATRGFLVGLAATLAVAGLSGPVFDDGRPGAISSSSLYAWVWTVVVFVGVVVVVGAGAAIRSHRWRRFALGGSAGALLASVALTVAMVDYLLSKTT